MRKHQKAGILDMMEEMEQNYKEMDRIGKPEKLEEILATCQEKAIRIGTLIEESEGEEHPIVHALEEYCEIVYTASQSTNNTTAFHEKLKQLLLRTNKIKKEIKDNLPEKKEIVFLPYKASMWDSLESIWMAAKEDKNCDCYVIPIPYFDLDKKNDTFIMHYEGDQFPDYVPITPYEEYSLKNRRPDIIYFHNPYDQFNYVTSVHPDYYSSELKKCTDLLVYVPYFATGGDMGDVFYELPSYYHADKIVIQSKEIRSFYSPNIPDDKFVPLGSPKFDRVINLHKMKLEIPSDWKNRIKGKKVVFYNTSISSLLLYGERAFTKMKYIFSCFTEVDDYVLLWRPHPLTKATLQSVRPQMLEEYNLLEEEFIKNEIGILDRTPDVTKVVAISDIYVGEESSSIVHLFGVSGKPIFILDMNIDPNRREETLDNKASFYFRDCYIENNEVWFIPEYYNSLCKMDMSSGEVEEITQIAKEDWDTSFCDISKEEWKIVAQPFSATEIWEYDLWNKVSKKTPIKDPVPANFDRMIAYQHYLFMKPKCYPALVRYDTRDGSLEYYAEGFHKYIQQDGAPMFFWAVNQRDNLLLMAAAKTNAVLEFNMDTNEFKTHIVGKEGNNYFSMAYDGKDYWLVQNEGKSIIRWNYETGKSAEYTDFPLNYIGEKEGFVSIVFCNSHLLAFPRMANMIVEINIKTGKMTEYRCNLPYKEGERKSEYFTYESNYLFAKSYDKTHIVALSAYDLSLIFIDTETNECKKIKCRLNETQLKTHLIHLQGFIKDNKYISYAMAENIFQYFQQFLKGETNGKHHNKEEQIAAYAKVAVNLDGTCGVKVHQSMMATIAERK
ncbi:MAG: hypothetical protein WBI07_14820 [Mobilitalea sp.]